MYIISFIIQLPLKTEESEDVDVYFGPARSNTATLEPSFTADWSNLEPKPTMLKTFAVDIPEVKFEQS